MGGGALAAVIDNGALASHIELLILIHGNAGGAGRLNVHLWHLLATEENLRLMVIGRLGISDDLSYGFINEKDGEEEAFHISRNS